MALKDFEAQANRCSNCAGCKFIPFDKVQSARFSENCPAVTFNNFTSYSARGRYQLTKTLLEGRCDYSDPVVDVIHSCMACGACDVACKICRYNLDVLEHNLELKASAIENGKILPRQEVMMDALKNEQTMLPGKSKVSRGDWAKDLNLKDIFKEGAEIAFFPGCKYSYDEKLRKDAQAAVKLLLCAGVDVSVLGSSDMCCAGRAYQMGFFDEFNQQAIHNIKLFEKSGVKTIVTPCSDCYHTLKRQYAALGLKIEILHLIEYVDRLVKEGRMTFSKQVPLTVTYHDPCHLGRLGEPYIPWEGQEKKIKNQIQIWEPRKPRYTGANGIYDSPRDILKSIPGLRLVEMERIREYSWCCGAGGGCSETNPELSAWTAGERIAEAASTGADAIVTACPWCENNLHNAAGENGGTMQVLDIMTLVLQAL